MLFSLSSSFIQHRTYATLKDIQMRLKSIKNIGKITKSMKMIASTKLNRAQKAMEIGQKFSETSTVNEFDNKIRTNKTRVAFLRHIEAGSSVESEIVTQTPKAPQLLIACSSDRGLCGAIHSSVSKFTKKCIENLQLAQTAEIIILGDKSKPQIARTCRKNIVMSFNQVGKNIPTLTDAIGIVQLIMKQQTDKFVEKEKESTEAEAEIKIIYNSFKSIIAYETIPVNIYSDKQLHLAPKLAAYEYEDSVLEAYSQFIFASQLFRALVEGHAAEMSAKRMAMENASKNSDAIVLNLTMLYNRTRQSVITNELVDIITGASAL